MISRGVICLMFTVDTHEIQ